MNVIHARRKLQLKEKECFGAEAFHKEHDLRKKEMMMQKVAKIHRISPIQFE